MSITKKKELSEIAKQLSRNLRKRSTPTETALWKELRNRKFSDEKFLRQHPLFYEITGKESFFIADFYCHKHKLIIELDGDYHKYQLIKDEKREEILNYLGLKVIRFTTDSVENNIDEVMKVILEKIKF